SAALEVAAATLLEKMTGQPLEPMDKVRLCQKAEHDFAGVPCGIMDQFTSVSARYNHALLLDCRSCTATPVRLDDPAVSVMVINTNVRHQLTDGAYAKRRNQCETAARTLEVKALRDATVPHLKKARKRLEAEVYRRARHVITENERTVQFAHALQARQWSTVGALMYASHRSLRDDYEVSCPELDAIVDIARDLGEAGGMIG